MKNLKFKTLHSTFNIPNLIGQLHNNPNISKLTTHLKSTDPSLEIAEPMPEDIQFVNDKWKVYMAFNESLVLEFLDNKLICIAFDLKFLDEQNINLSPEIMELCSYEKLTSNKDFNFNNGSFQRVLNKEIIMSLSPYDEQKERIRLVSFGDYETFSNEENLPNRYSEILASLIL